MSPTRSVARHVTPGLLLCVALAFGSTISGQNFASMPTGYVSTEAPNASIYFGSRDAMRCQVFTNLFRGNAGSVKELAGRLDGARAATNFHFAGRTWSSVKLTVAEASYANATTTFTQNLQANVKSVFSGSMTWPDRTTGGPTSKPHTWATDVKFPFGSPWLYSGNRDITLDFAFSGGTLANSAVWTTSRFYYLDGVHIPIRTGGGSTHFGTHNCPNAPYSEAPFCVPLIHSYSANTGNPRTANKFEFSWWMHRFPPSTFTILAVSLLGSTPGVNIGNACQNFHVNLGGSFLLPTTTPSSNASSFFAPRPPLTNTYSPVAVGVKVWTQAAYTHPTRNRLELTRAGSTTIQAQPPPLPGTKWTWAAPATSSTGGAIGAEYLPVFRLTN